MKLSFLFYEPIRRLEELSRRMGFLASLGYQGIEMSAYHPLDYPIEAVADLARQHRLPVVSLLSGWSYANEGLCLSRPDPEVRRRASERLIDYVRQAGQLGAVVVMGLMQGLRSDEPDEYLAGERIAAALHPVGQAAQEAGTTLVVEPVNHQQAGFHNTADEAAALVKRVPSPGIGYMLDTIHMHVEERSVLETIRRHGPRIRHFHLCESNGGPFGTGNLDFPPILQTLQETGYDHFVSVKVYRKASWDQAARGAMEFLKGCFKI